MGAPRAAIMMLHLALVLLVVGAQGETLPLRVRMHAHGHTPHSVASKLLLAFLPMPLVHVHMRLLLPAMFRCGGVSNLCQLAVWDDSLVIHLWRCAQVSGTM